MRLGRTLPPAAAPIYFSNILSGIRAGFRGEAVVQGFIEELKEFFQMEHCLLVSSGKAALLLILEALKELHPERDEVLIPALNCFSVPSAIVRAGLKVTLCDMDRETLDFDYEHLRCKLGSPRLLCVIPTHLFGRPADISRLKSMLADPTVTVIEDAAQAFGGAVAGKKLGTLGDVSLFSLGRGKALSTVEGGIVLTNQDALARCMEKIHARLPLCSRLRTFKLVCYALALAILQHPLLYWLPNSLPFLKLGQTVYDPMFKPQRFSAFQAGLASGWQRKIAFFKEIRLRNVSVLTATLGKLGQLQYGRCQGEALPLIRLPWQVESAYLRTQILARGRECGLGIVAIFPSTIAQIPRLKKDCSPETYPVAESLARTLVSLPVHPFANRKDTNRIERFLRNMQFNKEAGCLWRPTEEMISRRS